MMLIIHIEVVRIYLLIFSLHEVMKNASPSKSRKAEELPAAMTSECNGGLNSDDKDDFNSNVLITLLMPLSIRGSCRELCHLLWEITNA